jgi:hypothetical protein
MPHRPGLAERHFRETPAAHAFFVGVAGEDRVRLLPFARRQRLLPGRTMRYGPYCSSFSPLPLSISA